MLKSALLWASTNPFMARRLPRYAFVRRAVRKFMPGETLADGIAAAERLEERGFGTLVTELGENVETAEQARAVVDEYLEVCRRVESRDLDCEVSVKLTHLGLDRSTATTVEHCVEIARAARGIVWIDMEDSTYVNTTLEVYRAVRARVENVGICLQAYLRRTEGDFETLLPYTPHVRLVKGAYLESPVVAFAKKSEVDAAYRKLASRMLRERKAGRMGRVCLGTHDDRMIADAGRVAHELGMRKGEWEVAMLYGIRPGAQKKLLAKGIPTRILVSYGEHWFPWYMRRLAERPANVGFVFRSMIRA